MSRCLYCDSESHRTFSSTYDTEAREWPIHQCQDCSALFLSPAPTPEELQHSYSSTYYGEQEQKFDTWIGKARLYFSQQKSRRVACLLPPPADVLDIGCGSGEFLEHVHARGYRCTGIELESAARRLQRLDNINIEIGDISEIAMPESAFDFISLWHVVEHLPHAKRILKKVTRSLRPGGYLALALPNSESIQARLFSGHWFHWDPPRHLFLLGREALIKEVESLGYQLCDERNFLFEYDPYGYQQSLLNYFWPEKRDHLYEGIKAGGEKTDSTRLLMEKLYFYLSIPLAVCLSTFESAVNRGGTVELYFRKLES